MSCWRGLLLSIQGREHIKSLCADFTLKVKACCHIFNKLLSAASKACSNMELMLVTSGIKLVKLETKDASDCRYMWILPIKD